MIIDLHDMIYDEAIRYFINKYNESIKIDPKEEIIVIHGYGSTGNGGILKQRFKTFFKQNKDNLNFLADINPGRTFITPIHSIPIILDILSEKIVTYCSDSPKAIIKIQGKFHREYRANEVKQALQKLVKQDLIEVIQKKSTTNYLTR